MAQCAVGDVIKVGKHCGTIRSMREHKTGKRAATIASVAFEVRDSKSQAGHREDIVVGGRGAQKWEKVSPLLACALPSPVSFCHSLALAVWS